MRRTTRPTGADPADQPAGIVVTKWANFWIHRDEGACETPSISRGHYGQPVLHICVPLMHAHTRVHPMPASQVCSIDASHAVPSVQYGGKAGPPVGP